MALPDVFALKQRLRIETTVEDALLSDFLAQARAWVESYIRQPVEARPVTVELSPVWAAGNTFSQRLAFPLAPIGAGGVVVTDADGATVADADYTISTARGWLTFGSSGAAGSTYTVTAVAGLSLRDDYLVAVEPVIAAAILDVAADFYQRRNPAAEYEAAGGGVAVTYSQSANEGVPARIRALLAPFRRPLV